MQDEIDLEPGAYARQTHAFIVRIWTEPREIRGTKVQWRGSVEHVPTGERCYVNDLDAITAFLAAYLEKMGAQSPIG
ncbi:MAG TPA: hypothetical protein VEX13_17420 [Chloroflexia bacterium]|nr:hypothetical protein [Chloroflexia bacterium]